MHAKKGQRDGQHTIHAVVSYRVTGKYSLSRTQILNLSSSIAILECALGLPWERLSHTASVSQALGLV